jgi:serine/threonine protein phosphatase PrpC
MLEIQEQFLLVEIQKILPVRIDNKIVAMQVKAMSIDHKPDDPREAKKILAGGGRIDTFKDQNGGNLGPQRVWLKNEDIPGLAMSRSFGDAVSMLAGVNAEPEVLQHELTKQEKIMIIASDGVWEFLSNEEVGSLK